MNAEPNWNQRIAGLPQAHLLQTAEWARAKQPFGWSAHTHTWPGAGGEMAAAAQILQRSVRLPLIGKELSMLYVPKGPLLRDWGDAALRRRVLADLRQKASELGAFFIKIDPDIELGRGVPGEADAFEKPLAQEIIAELKAEGWRYSNEQVQMPNTMVIDLGKSEDELLAAMKQKTRYNLRLSERKGVRVRRGGPDDFGVMYRMYAETSVRDGFVIRSEEYYRAVWDEFHAAGMLTPLLAEVDGQPVAGLMLFIFGQTSWYLYGMSRNMAREWMPNYLLQWEAIKLSKAAGCEVYDLWGAPDEFNEHDSMWGVFRFKQGLGARTVRHIGAWDLPLQPLTYSLYTQALPRLIALMQWRGRGQTRRQLLSGEPG
ncbi:MAG: peptidoglycan bridge formation glycyltransferase FemA/FemB family protein [Anaerolineales bacterium]|nr:peptidoglycan bridge formation glycyltransferase FemA/FemB family protein [Anaerolineales bacterium]